MQFKKIFDINNQIEQITNDIIKSKEMIHYLMVRSDGLIYVADISDAVKCIKSNEFNILGIITKPNTRKYIKDKLTKLIKEYNNKTATL